MWIVLCLGLTFGLLASSWANFTQEVKVRGCSYKGVFYVQGNDRHTLTFEEAQKICSSVEATVASAEEITAAYGTGMEICRYGWISDGNLTIVRQKPNPLCRNSHTGVIIFKPGKDEKSDAFCYDDSDLSDKNCTLAINLSSTEDPPVPPSKIPKTEETSVPPNEASTTDNNPLSDPTASDWPEQSTLTSVTDTENTAVTTDDSPFQSSTTPFLPPIDTTEPDTNDEFLATESSAQTQQTEVNGKSEEQSTTIVMTLDNTSSGMWEPPAKDLETTVDPSDNSYTYTGETTSTELTSRDEKNLAGSGGRMISEDDDKSSDWLIIVGVIVAVLAILLICAAVATRKRWCGKRQTLMITSKSSSEGNGATASASSSRAQEREQEMVTLMNKEKIQENGNTEEFTVITLEESPEKNQQA